jgi:arylsulfatase A-like enzyme
VIQTTLSAFAFGSLVSMATLVAESLIRGSGFRPESAAAYGLLGGVLCALVRAASHLLLPVQIARVATFLAGTALPMTAVSFYLNRCILAGEPFLSNRSLALDGVAGGLWLAAGMVAVRGSLVSRFATRGRRWPARLGAVLFLGQVASLGWDWPREVAPPERDGKGPNLLLIVLDSMRRDHAGFQGYDQPTSPFLDGLVPEARIYTNAFSASSWTAPSVDWILGSPPGASRLPELLRQEGYVTACFTDNPHLGGNAEILRGFDYVDRSVSRWRAILLGTLLGEGIERLYPGDDRRLANKALAWAASTKGPFFLYVHLMDSHAPYDSPPIDGRERPGRRVEFPVTGMSLSDAEVDDIIARYDGGIRSADGEAGRLITAAASWRRPFIAVATSDHGESLGEGGRWYHGQSLAPELLAVPLLVVGQGVEPGRVEAPTGFSSISRTLLAAAGISCAECAGSDLRSGDGDGAVSGALPPHARYRIAGGYKLIVDERAPGPLLYDLEADPGETRNLGLENAELVRALGDGLPELRDLPGPASEDIERLKALGYAER